jgi:peptide/nickel transport system permease protein
VIPVFLATDKLLWLLVAGVVLYAIHVRRSPHLLIPWRRVTHSASGLSALIVLLAFIAIGLLDSLHYRPALDKPDEKGQTVYAVEAVSVLDWILAPVRAHRERTYSAPLATRAYAKETIEVTEADGKVRQTREFPRLIWGGAHLKNEDDRAADIATRGLAGLGIALAAWFAIAWGLTAWRARVAGRTTKDHWRAIWRGETATPWWAVLLTAGALIVVVGVTSALCTHYHVLGTEKVGQDVLYLVLKSIRTALVIGTVTTLVLLPFAIALGISAGYFRGWIDDVVQYVYTTISSIPSVLLIAAAVLLMQVYLDRHPELYPTSAQRADLRLLFLCIILGATSWTGLARLLRGEALKLRELEYIQAAQAFGVRDANIIARHILPNVMHIVLITVVLEFSSLVLAEAVLSYVGVGVDPTMNSFGTMINAARLEMSREPVVWWILIAAFVFMFALVLSANLFADAVRDAFDPRVRVGGLAKA